MASLVLYFGVITNVIDLFSGEKPLIAGIKTFIGMVLIGGFWVVAKYLIKYYDPIFYKIRFDVNNNAPTSIAFSVGILVGVLFFILLGISSINKNRKNKK